MYKPPLHVIPLICYTDFFAAILLLIERQQHPGYAVPTSVR